MRARLLTVATVLLPTLVSSANYSIRNPAIGNPVGSGTAPVSDWRDSLVRTPSPIETTGNLVITGNVRAGRSFQGPVQYNSTTQFGADLGTSTLSSFLRDTAGAEDLGRYRQRYRTQPYYLPAETVATTVPGRPGVFKPIDRPIRTLAPQQRRPAETHLFALEPLPKPQIAPGRGTITTDADFQGLRTRYGPLTEPLTTSDGEFVSDISSDLRNIERLSPGDPAVSGRDERLTTERLAELRRQSLVDAGREVRIEDRQALMDIAKLEPEARTPAQLAADAKGRLAAEYRLSPLETREPSVAPGLQPEAIKPGEPIELELPPAPAVPTPAEPDGIEARPVEGLEAETGAALAPSRVGPEGVYEDKQGEMLRQIRQQLDELRKSVESRLRGADRSAGEMPTQGPYRLSPVTEARPAGSGETLSPYGPDGVGMVLDREILTPAKTSGAFGGIDYGSRMDSNSTERPALEVSRRITSLPSGLSNLSVADMSTEATRIMGAHQSLDSLSQDKFDRHMLAGQDHLRTGKYYKAANSFALASMYKPGDPQALVGRSHALFAAGEYVSSALFLSRALAISPDHAKIKVDLATMLGGQGRLAGRIEDVEQWFARSGSGSLQLLLGYVYCQTGRFNEAAKAVEAASAKMPQSPAIPAISSAIDDAAAR